MAVIFWDLHLLIYLLECAQSLINKGAINSIRFSTRPDTITRESLARLTPYQVSTIELGVQSMDNTVLQKSNRGHTSEDTEKAAVLLKKNGFETGMQMMVGLPGDSDRSSLDTAEKIARLSPAFVRIYPLLVLKGSLVHEWYLNGRYQPMPLEHAVNLVKQIYLIFNDLQIPVIRMGLQASEGLIHDDALAAGPWHPAFGHLVFSRLFLDKAICMIEKKRLTTDSKTIILKVHPSSESRLRGDKNQNMTRIKNQFPGVDFIICTDPALEKNEIIIPWHDYNMV